MQQEHPNPPPTGWRWFQAGQAERCSDCGRDLPAGTRVWTRWTAGASNADDWLCDTCQATAEILDGDGDPSGPPEPEPVPARGPETQPQVTFRPRRRVAPWLVAGAVAAGLWVASGSGHVTNGDCPANTKFRPDTVLICVPITTTATPTTVALPQTAPPRAAPVKPLTAAQRKAFAQAANMPDPVVDCGEEC